MNNIERILGWWRWNVNHYNSSGAKFIGIAIYGDYHKAWWSKWFLQPVFYWFQDFYNFRLSLKYRFFPSYRKRWFIDTGAHRGWNDCDTLILHACMAILCMYLEDECGGEVELEKFTKELEQPGSEGYGPREAVDRQSFTQAEALRIYRWWKYTRPQEKKKHAELVNHLYGGKRRMRFVKEEDSSFSRIVFDKMTDQEEAMRQEMHDLEEKIYRDEKQMLIDLMEIRTGLWT